MLDHHLYPNTTESRLVIKEEHSTTFSMPNSMDKQIVKEGIAIIGIGCRFPGGVNDAEAFWKLLVDGRDAVSDVPADRWNVERYFDAEPGLTGKSIARRGGFIDGLDQFDPQFFGISPREAPYIDPQQRLLLETAWEAIDDAGIILDLEHGTDIGVFVGISHNDYQIIQGTPWDSSGISAHSPTGSAHSIAANRISYCFNLQGPSVAMDTACSSALTAVYAACEHLWRGRSKAALAGGVTVMITPGGFIGFSQASMLSPDGQCKAFDASANGFVRGEGAGMVLLKRVSDAIANGDPIHGVILGSALNQDGHTNGISLPSPEAQARLVRDACIDAGISPLEIGFVEAHGTGTAVGDPIEAHALAEALCTNRSADAPLLIGSVKTNLGHLETAAGIAGLLKAVLILKHRKIPASLHFQTPNPNIDFSALKLRVPTKLEAFPASDGPPMIGVNSFGFGGANAHVIVTEAPQIKRPSHDLDIKDRGWPLMLSARSEKALRSMAWKMSDWLEARLSINGDSPTLPDLVYSLGARRNHHPHRLALVIHSAAEAIGELNQFATGEQAQKIRTAFAARREHPARIAFVMSGQGPQWWGMGRQLMRHEPVFREVIVACDAAMRPWASFSLLEEIGRDEEHSQIRRTEIAQPAIFAMQVALAALWKSWGVRPPHAIIGHSVGEIAAACVAGVLSLEDAARVIILRARHMENCARGEGTMLAVGLDEAAAHAVIARHDRTVSIAAFNGPRSLTLSGSKISLEAIAAELEAEGIFARFVRVDHPFHHLLMQPAADSLAAALADLKPQAETIPFFSTVTGQRCKGENCGAEHWARGVRQAVQFAPAVKALTEFGADVWLELSAHPALAASIQECLTAQSSPKVPVLSSTRRDREHDSMLETAMNLHLAGVELDFKAMTPSRRQLSLPAYAWDKSRWWHESSDWQAGRLSRGGRGLLHVRMPHAIPTWTAKLDNRHMAFLKDHRVESHIVFPAAAYVDMVLEAGVDFFEGRPFVIEDLEIRKALILPDPVSGLMLELVYNPAESTFTLRSKFENSAAWSVHVLGSMRCERTDAAFASSSWETDMTAELKAMPVNEFYEHMSRLGLRYGEEFRAVRELSANGGKSSGCVALSENISARAQEYPLHPVLLDGSLHVFSAGARTVEGPKAGMKLPVRFSRILYLRSPGASCSVLASVQQCNEEFIEGNLRLYDSSGAPCVCIDGFRAISMTAARRSGVNAGLRDVLYHIEWERTESGVSMPPPPVPLDRLREVASRTLNEVISMRGRAKLEATMVAEDQLAATLIARGLSEMGVQPDKPFTAASLGVAESMRPAFDRLIAGLVLHKLLKAKGRNGGHVTTARFVRTVNSAPEALRKFLYNHPGQLPEGLLCDATCSVLGPIMRGAKDAVQVLFSGAGADLLEQFYGDGLFSSHWMAAIASAISEAARHLPEGRGLRILEVGAGTAGLSAYLLPLLQRGLHSYVFSDVSAAFFSAAGQKLAAFPEVEFKVFDLDKPATEQGFEPATFDFVIGTNVIHAAADVRAALDHIRTLLAPDGTLMFMDVATPHLWTESVFGLTSGWWHLKDRELRPEHPLLQRTQWEAVLRDVGFAETASLPGLHGPLGEGQIGLLARKPWQPAASVAPVLDEAATETSWLIFTDALGVGDKLAAQLTAGGAHCCLVKRGHKFISKSHDSFELRSEEPEDWQRLIESLAVDSLPRRLVYLWSLDQPLRDETLWGTDALLHLSQALARVSPAIKLRIDLVTRGAQPVGDHPQTVAVAQMPSIGIFRVILNEYPNLTCHSIDLPPEASSSDEILLWNELLRDDTEREIAFRGEARYAQRIERGLASREQWLDASMPLRLESKERGLLDSLRFTPFTQPACKPGEVLIEVKAAGINFRDVLKALALYPVETPDARIFGDEVGGIVKAVGDGVTHVAVGDRVFGLAVFGLATQTIARGSDVRRIPNELSFEEAATLPVVFMTAWHALKNVAHMRAGESILVHAGAGGVGMAAIQIAHHLGVQVIATAGSPAKRALLETLGVKHVIDSRRGDFADAVMNLTDRRGVNVVLNSLAAEAIPMGLSCLAEFGRFIEIGKRDIYQNTRIPLWPLRRNASFHVVAMDAVFSGDNILTRNLLTELVRLVEKGALTPLPFRAFPACRVDAAFRLMAQGKHIGKVIVTFSESFVPRRGEPPAPSFKIQPDASYLITGAFGGFGRVLAQWLVNNGARHLILCGRSGAASPAAKAFVQDLNDKGVATRVIKADTGSDKDVSRLINIAKTSTAPLRGIFHLAMVIDDAPLSALTAERLRAVMAPKARGAWLLHNGTQDIELDCFVMFSSVSSIFGNPAQGNYAAANAYLDALAHHRRALGLPALTINWGVLGGEGYVARNERVAEFLSRQGTSALTPGEVMMLLEAFLAADTTQVAAIRVDWSKWRQSFRGLQENPLLERLFASGVESQENSGTASNWRPRIEAARPEEKEGLIGQAVREVVGSVLRLKPDSLRDDQPLTDLGLDSLMGVEIENSIESALGVTLPPTSLMRARTIGQITTLIAEYMGGVQPAGSAVKDKLMLAVSVSADEVDLDALSDEEIEHLLGETTGDVKEPSVARS